MATGLGIDIGSDCIKIVQARVSGNKVTVTGALKMPRRTLSVKTDDEEPEAEQPEKPGAAKADDDAGFVLPAGLSDEIKRAKLGRTGTVGVSGREIVLKYLSIPPMPKDKINMFLRNELADALPNKAGEPPSPMTFDWRILNIPGGLKSDLVLMASVCKNPYLMEVFNNCKKAGLHAEHITPTCFGLVHAYLNTQLVKEGETVVLADIGHQLTEIAILDGSNLYFARSAPGGGKKFTAAIDRALKCGAEKAEAVKRSNARIYGEGEQIASKQEVLYQSGLKEAADGIASAIRSSVMFCRTQTKIQKLDFAKVYISGGGAKLKGLAPYLEKKLGKPVQPLDLSIADTSKLTGDAAGCFEAGASEMSLALGLAIIDAAPRSLHFAMVPADVLKKRELWRKTAFGVVAGLVLMAGIYQPYINAKAAVDSTAAKISDFQALQLKATKAKLDFESDRLKNQAIANSVEYRAQQTRISRAYLEMYKAVREEFPENMSLIYLGPETDISASASANANGVGIGMGNWLPDRGEVLSMIMRGYYSEAAYKDKTFNEAYEAFRAKFVNTNPDLLKVHGVKSMLLDTSTDLSKISPRPGFKPFEIKIALTDPKEYITVAAPVAPAPGTSSTPTAKKTETPSSEPAAKPKPATAPATVGRD